MELLRARAQDLRLRRPDLVALLPAERQVTVITLNDEQRSQIPFLVFSDSSALRRQFHIRERRTADAVIVNVKPRNSAVGIREATVTIDRKTHRIRQLSYTDRPGNKTAFEFKNYRQAAEGDLAFRFIAPPGVDVVQAQ
jgi:outer membrane lipoprotein-sorting protein